MKTLFIITGTTQGLGSAISTLTTSNDQNTVYVLNRRETGINTSNYNNIVCDLAVMSEIENAMDTIFKSNNLNDYQRMILINNAGVVKPIKFIHKANFSEIEECINTNIRAVALTTSLFLKNTEQLDLEKIVVNISSGAAQKPAAGWSIYTASKAAVEIFTKSVAMEQDLLKFPAKIIAFQPGKVETKMQELVRNTSKDDLPTVDVFIESHKKNENFTPELVAKTLLELIDGEIVNGEVYKARELINN